MSSKAKKSNRNNSQVKNNTTRSKAGALSAKAAREVDKKKPGSTWKRYKTLLICIICEGDAHGYNFDAISCESCKAFFRRNALRPLEKLKCRGDGQCAVKFNVKKRCKKCRLAKCLHSGMRKEWILSDKEKEGKRVKIEINRLLKQTHDSDQEHQSLVKRDSKTTNHFSPLLEQSYLTDLDWTNIQSIQDGFIEAVKLNQIAGIASYPSTQPIQSTLDLFRVPLYISSMRLISFIKQINEFRQLEKSEQLHLVKLNLLTMSFFHSIFIYDCKTDCYHEQDTTDPLFAGTDWVRTLNEQFHIEMKQLRNDFLNIFQMDNIIIKLFYIILLFSQQMFVIESSPFSSLEIHSLNIFKAQNVFTDLLYRYCIHQYGPTEAARLFSRYIIKMMKLQQLIDQIKYSIESYIDPTQLSPLAQSLLG